MKWFKSMELPVNVTQRIYFYLKNEMTENQISKIVLNAALKVHRNLGPGLLESAYEECLFYELSTISVKVKGKWDYR